MASSCTGLWTPLGILILVAGPSCSRFRQNPRFVAAKRGTEVHFICQTFSSNDDVHWYKQADHKRHPQLVETSSSVGVTKNSSAIMIHIPKVQYTDSGIYFCQRNISTGDSGHALGCSCKSELKVIGFSTIKHVQSRNTLKDAIIMVQSVLLALFVSVPLLLFMGKGESKQNVGEDHTYEGLAIEQTDTYEDIGIYQSEGVKWIAGEHPGQE
uniref:CD79b molecule n=1 Tax=Sphenodon punctatus TaxID=8508 RepID=A0A8D0GYP0_SPHPU